jgi:uncharacterized protein YebE (UPF0316 family)
MMMNAIIIFAIATVVNVTLSTVRSICTIKGGKWISAITNAICYGFYPLIVMLTAKGTVDIVVNMAITAIANFICVWIIKFVEEKARKDKLWKVEATVLRGWTKELHKALVEAEIPHNYLENVGKYTLFNIFCEKQSDSAKAKVILNQYNAKYFVTESKNL